MAHGLATALEQNARRTGCTGRKAAAIERIDRCLFATRGRRHGTSRCAAAESTARNEKNKGSIRENRRSFLEKEWSFAPPLRCRCPKGRHAPCEPREFRAARAANIHIVVFLTKFRPPKSTNLPTFLVVRRVVFRVVGAFRRQNRRNREARTTVRRKQRGRACRRVAK